MKKILLSLFSACLFAVSMAQTISVETVQVHTGMVGTVNLAGYTTYRVYVNFDNTEDFVSAVGGDANRPFELICDGTVYQSALGGNLGNAINPALFPFFPHEAFDSWLTIDVETNSAANTFLGQVQDNTQPFLTTFNQQGSFLINTVVGGGWFTLFPSINGYAGSDLKVLLMQITTNGPFTGCWNVDYFQNGEQANMVQANNMCFSSNPADIFGCMDPAASNYNPAATQQDFSCELPCALDASYSITPTDCAGQNNGAITVDIDGAQGTAYLSWNGGPFQVIYTKTDLAAGNYTVEIEDGNGCTFSDVVTIPGPSPITGTLFVNSGCNNQGNAFVTGNFSGGTPPFMFGLTNGNYTQSSPVFTNLSSGFYTVFAIDSNGCTGQTSQAQVTNPPNINIVNLSSTNASCSGLSNGSISGFATGGVGTFTYSINGMDYQDSGMFNGVGVGSYVFYAKDSNGCVKESDPISITALTGYSIFASVAEPISCNGGSDGSIQIGLVGSTTGVVSYGLVNGVYNNTSGTFSDLDAGNYTVFAIDEAGCPAVSAIVNLSDPAALGLSLSSTVLCFGDDNTDGIAAVVSNAFGAVMYSIDGGAFESGDVLATLDYDSYDITAMDENGCVASASIDFQEPDAVELIATSTNVLCFDDANGTISIDGNGGVGDIVYSINGGSAQPSGTFTGLAAGSYTVMVMDSNGCSTEDEVTITEPEVVTLSTSSSNVACNGQNNGTVTATADGGTGAFNYTLNGGTPNTTGNFSGLGANTYTVVATDANGCSATSTATVSQPQVLAVTGVATGDTWGGNGAVNITVAGGTGPYTYEWSNDATTEDLTGLTGGPYSVTVTDANGCTATQSFNVSVGVFELIAGLNVAIFPNPSQGEFFLNIEGLNGEKLFLQVTDARGRVVLGEEMFDNSGSVRTLVNLTQVADGMYFLHLNVNGATGTMKLVKH